MAPKSLQQQLEEVRLEKEQLELEDLRDRVEARRQQKEARQMQNERSIAEFKKNEAINRARQARCKHRKGGKDNKFADGNSQNYSVIQNTYPTGRIVISCTRCGKEVERPDPKLRKADPKLYAERWQEWQTWLQYPTDNTPSGTKTHEIVPTAA